MASKSNVYAGVAGYVGRADQKGAVGVFTRPAETGRWEHVLTDQETYTVNIHPTDPNVVFAGTADGVYRSTDRGKTFQRTNFPDSERPDLVVPGGCQRPEADLCRGLADQPVSQRGHRRDVAEAAGSRDAGPRGDAVRLPRDADGAASVEAGHHFRRAGGERRDAHRRWRRKLERLQFGSDPAGAAAASEKQDRQRYVSTRACWTATRSPSARPTRTR